MISGSLRLPVDRPDRAVVVIFNNSVISAAKEASFHLDGHAIRGARSIRRCKFSTRLIVSCARAGS